MPRKQAEIFALWEEILEANGGNLYALAKQTGIDYKWLRDFFNDRYIARQVLNVKKIERALNVPPVALDRYDSKGDEE